MKSLHYNITPIYVPFLHTLNPRVFFRQSRCQFGKMPCTQSCVLQTIIIPEKLYLYHQERSLLIVSGFIKSSIKLMDRLKDIRHDWSRKGILNSSELISLIFSHRLQNWSLLGPYYLLLLSSTRVSHSQMLIMLFFMEICMKKYT